MNRRTIIPLAALSIAALAACQPGDFRKLGPYAGAPGFGEVTAAPVDGNSPQNFQAGIDCWHWFGSSVTWGVVTRWSGNSVNINNINPAYRTSDGRGISIARCDPSDDQPVNSATAIHWRTW